MSRPAPPPPPDPRKAVLPTAVLSLLLLAIAAASGLAAASSETWSLIHGIAVSVALPVSFVAHLVALVAVKTPSSAPGP